MGTEPKELPLHYEEDLFVASSPREVFAYADDHRNFSSHMTSSSWRMGGGRMETQLDGKNGRGIGAHIVMKGKAFGIPLFLDEVVMEYEPPHRKVWETVGDVKLVVIGHYRLGFEIKPEEKGSKMRVFIDYARPMPIAGKMYAKWCVGEMTKAVRNHFKGGEIHG